MDGENVTWKEKCKKAFSPHMILFILLFLLLFGFFAITALNANGAKDLLAKKLSEKLDITTVTENTLELIKNNLELMGDVLKAYQNTNTADLLSLIYAFITTLLLGFGFNRFLDVEKKAGEIKAAARKVEAQIRRINTNAAAIDLQSAEIDAQEKKIQEYVKEIDGRRQTIDGITETMSEDKRDFLKRCETTGNEIYFSSMASRLQVVTVLLLQTLSPDLSADAQSDRFRRASAQLRGAERDFSPERIKARKHIASAQKEDLLCVLTDEEALLQEKKKEITEKIEQSPPGDARCRDEMNLVCIRTCLTILSTQKNAVNQLSDVFSVPATLEGRSR